MRRLWLASLGTLCSTALLIFSSSTAAGAETRLFSSYDLVDLTLEAPLHDLFAGARRGADYAVNGRVLVADARTNQKVEIPDVNVSTRGHTSKQSSECDFPKLKISFASPPPGASPFAGLKAVKLGTHCGDREETTLTAKYGRLPNEKATHREALVYRVLEALGVPTLRARPARITYVFTDSDAARESTTASAPLVRSAMLLEDDASAMKRFGGIDQFTEDQFESAESMFTPADTVTLAFAEALIGNFDWCLRFDPGDHYRCDNRHPLWNILGLVRAERRALPVIYDFDLSGFVVGRHVWFKQVFSTAFLGSDSEAEVEVLSQLQRTRTLFSRQELDAGRAAFVKNKAAAYRAVAAAVVDGGGRKHAETYMNAFFAIIENDKEFYRPVVAKPETRAFVDAARTQPACGSSNLVPVGTPVSEPLETSRDMVRVRLLDALWQWAPSARCDVVHQQPVWIQASAIDRDYPR